MSSLANTYLAGRAGLTAKAESAPQPTTPMPTMSPEMFQAIRDSVTKENAAVGSAGLAGAVQRQIAKAKPSAFATAGVDVAAELRPLDDDGVLLGLAKAIARQCVRQLGVVKSERPIEAVRALAAGRAFSSPQSISGRRSEPRVLAAAPRR